MTTWEEWLTAVRQHVGNPYERLWSGLQGDPSINDECVEFPKNWFGRVGLGRNLWTTQRRKLRGPSIGFYIEPVGRKALGDDEYHASSACSHLEFSTRLPSSKLARAAFGPDFQTGAANLIAAQFTTFGSAIAAEPVIYPYEGPPPSQQVQIVKDLPDWGEDDEGLWVSLRASQTFDYRANADDAPSAGDVAKSLIAQWDRYVEVIQFLRGFLTKPAVRTTKVEGLIGFVGEYVVSRSLPAGTVWVGGYADHDFLSADGTIYYEVKTALGEIPRWPYFTANEIRRALSCNGDQYRLRRVALDREQFASLLSTLQNLGNMPKDRLQGTDANEPWVLRLAQDFRISDDLVRSRAKKIRPLLDEFVGVAGTLEDTENPFLQRPLCDLREVARSLGAGSIQLWIS